MWIAKGMLEHIVRHGHPLQPRLSPDVTMFSCHWTLIFKAERVGLSPCNGFSTKISFTHRSHCAPSSSHLNTQSHRISSFIKSSTIPTYPKPSPAAMGEWQSNRWRWPLAVVVMILHVGGLGPVVVRLCTRETSNQRSPAASWATEQPFLGQHCSP